MRWIWRHKLFISVLILIDAILVFGFPSHRWLLKEESVLALLALLAVFGGFRSLHESRRLDEQRVLEPAEVEEWVILIGQLILKERSAQLASLDAPRHPFRLDPDRARAQARDTVLAPPLVGVAAVQQLWNADRQLVVLGESGTGKTSLSLELVVTSARDRAKVHMVDSTTDEPLVELFALSSWHQWIRAHQPERSMADWMANQIVERYEVPPTVASALLAAHRIIPVLDGLDDLPNEPLRRQCLEAIAAFANPDQLPFVLTSTKEDYLRANDGSIIDPTDMTLRELSKEEILSTLDDNLDEIHTDWQAKRRSIAEGTPAGHCLEELFRSPLYLHATLAAYRSSDLTELTTTNLQNARQRVWDRSINVVANSNQSRHHPRDFRAWLAWLARRMNAQPDRHFQRHDLISHANNDGCSDRIAWTTPVTFCLITLMHVVGATIMFGRDHVGPSVWLLGILVAGFVNPLPTDLRLPVGISVSVFDPRIRGNRSALQRCLALGFGWGLVFALASPVATGTRSTLMLALLFGSAQGAVLRLYQVGATPTVHQRIGQQRAEREQQQSGQNQQRGVDHSARPFGWLGWAGVLLSTEAVLLTVFLTPFHGVLGAAIRAAALAGGLGLQLAYIYGGIRTLEYWVATRRIASEGHFSSRPKHFLGACVTELPTMESAPHVQLLRRVGPGYVFYHDDLRQHLTRSSEDGAVALTSAPRFGVR